MSGSVHAVSHQQGGGSARADPPGVHARRSKRGTAVLRSAVLVWVVGWLMGTAVSLGAVVDVPRLPQVEPRYGAALVTVLLIIALARRAGGSVWLWTSLGATFVVLVLLADEPWLYSSAAVLVAVVGAVAAVVITRPAPTYPRLLLEYAIALVLATSAALAVAGYAAPVSPGRYYVLVLALSLAASMVLAWRLDAGFHGPGRRSVLLMVAGAVLVTAILIYSRVLREYGSASITTALQEVVAWIQSRLNGVPRPIEVFVGFPALLWGVHTRAVRRQGWWMCAFATFGTATVATTLATPVDPAYAGRSLLYSISLGLLIGLIVLQVESARGRRRTAVDDKSPGDQRRPEALRVEQGRTYPLR